MLNSLRTRLTLWYISVLALVIFAFAAITYLLVSRNLSQTLDNNLAEIGRSVEADLHKEEADIAAERLLPVTSVDDDEDDKKPGDAPGEALTIEQAIAEELEDLRSRDYGFVVFAQGENEVASTVAEVKLLNGLRTLLPETSFADLPGENEVFRVHQMAFRLDEKPFRLLITRPVGEQTVFLAGLRRIFFITVPIALLLSGLGGYFLARRSLAPVVSMSVQAEKIGSANLNERLPVKNERDEIGNLAKVFNDLLSRLERSFEQQKQFMADASHELRTPLAIVRGEAEVAISREDRAASEYRESLSIVHDESVQLTKIVEDLFILARADSGQLKPRLAPVYLDEILVECVRAAGSLAKKRKVKIDFAVPGEMPLFGDETLLHRLFLNLLDNAIKYNCEGGTVTITAQNEPTFSRLTITNTGEAIPVEDQTKIFDRFYRTDKSRSRDNTNGKNGIGLGLSIAAWIAEVHEGSLALLKSDSDSSVFQVELPSPGKKRWV